MCVRYLYCIIFCCSKRISILFYFPFQTVGFGPAYFFTFFLIIPFILSFFVFNFFFWYWFWMRSVKTNLSARNNPHNSKYAKALMITNWLDQPFKAEIFTSHSASQPHRANLLSRSFWCVLSGDRWRVCVVLVVYVWCCMIFHRHQHKINTHINTHSHTDAHIE